MENVVLVQFFHKPKTSLKNKVYGLKKHTHEYNPLGERFLTMYIKAPRQRPGFTPTRTGCELLSFFFLAVPVT